MCALLMGSSAALAAGQAGRLSVPGAAPRSVAPAGWRRPLGGSRLSLATGVSPLLAHGRGHLQTAAAGSAAGGGGRRSTRRPRGEAEGPMEPADAPEQPCRLDVCYGYLKGTWDSVSRLFPEQLAAARDAREAVRASGAKRQPCTVPATLLARTRASGTKLQELPVSVSYYGPDDCRISSVKRVTEALRLNPGDSVYLWLMPEAEVLISRSSEPPPPPGSASEERLLGHLRVDVRSSRLFGPQAIQLAWPEHVVAAKAKGAGEDWPAVELQLAAPAAFSAGGSSGGAGTRGTRAASPPHKPGSRSQATSTSQPVLPPAAPPGSGSGAAAAGSTGPGSGGGTPPAAGPGPFDQAALRVVLFEDLRKGLRVVAEGPDAREELGDRGVGIVFQFGSDADGAAVPAQRTAGREGWTAGTPPSGATSSSARRTAQKGSPYWRAGGAIWGPPLLGQQLAAGGSGAQGAPASRPLMGAKASRKAVEAATPETSGKVDLPLNGFALTLLIRSRVMLSRATNLVRDLGLHHGEVELRRMPAAAEAVAAGTLGDSSGQAVLGPQPASTAAAPPPTPARGAPGGSPSRAPAVIGVPGLRSDASPYPPQGMMSGPAAPVRSPASLKAPSAAPLQSLAVRVVLWQHLQQGLRVVAEGPDAPKELRALGVGEVIAASNRTEEGEWAVVCAASRAAAAGACSIGPASAVIDPPLPD
ncbi:hypothetical protein HYH03_001694 [Edaphochlamys debaryana]|uniref:Uncharacterized protein n=1 Tax=Edaphochlamys debaryana TaxID=47281 RepID=A0A836C5V9_9CHLO|nr:hypothetical protein HYH03_001694 [Edaphochlamys debaryana]|eukprot:KAG2500112.1 hypothetical protein HYH03_001694 [Edaphochlamys debaryana]